MSKAGRNGVTSNTPKNIMFGAGTIHKNLAYTAGTGGAAGSWNFEDSIVGATAGGSKFSVTPEVTTVEVDGVLVKTKGFHKKTGEAAQMEINFAEIKTELIKAAVIGKSTAAEDSTYTKITTKPDIETGDYWDNIGFVGETLEGKKIIVIMRNALCTSGFELEGKNKEAGTLAATFECNADLEDEGTFDTLPVEIYYPSSN